MHTNCNVCIKNKSHLYMNCKYNKDLIIDENVYYQDEIFEDLDLISYECPRFNFIENQFLYSILKKYNNNLNLEFDKCFVYRNASDIYKLYVDIIQNKTK